MSLWNFVSSLIDVSLTNRTKSNLFMTTISEPLSGSEITMPSRFFCWSMFDLGTVRGSGRKLVDKMICWEYVHRLQYLCVISARFFECDSASSDTASCGGPLFSECISNGRINTPDEFHGRFHWFASSVPHLATISCVVPPRWHFQKIASRTTSTYLPLLHWSWWTLE